MRSLDESDYTVYIVQVIGPAQSYEVERRFTEFKELREAIAKTELAATLEPMPEKRLFKMAQVRSEIMTSSACLGRFALAPPPPRLPPASRGKGGGEGEGGRGV